MKKVFYIALIILCITSCSNSPTLEFEINDGKEHVVLDTDAKAQAWLSIANSFISADKYSADSVDSVYKDWLDRQK